MPGRGEPHPHDPDIPADMIRAHLAAILASEMFVSTVRPRRFLEFVVEQTLAGKQDVIKESVLGSEVFGREPGYDPRTDAIVRIEATKLRTRLADYYAGPGSTADVRIEIPKGSYVPRFSVREYPADPPRRHWATRRVAAVAALGVLAVLGGLWVKAWKAEAVPDAGQGAPAIAVLPFLNLSSDPENEYFSDGLTEQLTDILAQVNGLRVASRTSAFTFKGKPAQASDIGQTLGVSVLVEGSVRKSGDRLRITAQLVRTTDGYHLWSRTFERSLNDIFELQDEISRQIAHELRVSLAEDAKRRFFARYTRDIEAFDLYLRGRYILGSFEPDAPDRALVLFEQALARDPRFAMAYVGIAMAGRQDEFTDARPPAGIASQVKSAAERALEIDPSLAEAQVMLAHALAVYDWNWSEADRTFRRAIEMNPQAPEVHFNYALSLLLPLRRYDEAFAECRKAVELDPVTTQWSLCAPWILMTQNPEQAIAAYKKLLLTNPAHSALRQGLAIAAANSGGHQQEAIDTLEQLKAESFPAGAGLLGYAYGRVGRTADALRIERQLRALPGPTPASALTLVYLGLHKKTEARQMAERQIRERNPSAYLLAFMPLLEPLRQDPELAPLLKTIGLPFASPAFSTR